jgi:hypothetical protein
MKRYFFIGLTFLLGSSTAFGYTNDVCQQAWKRSPAYSSCSLGGANLNKNSNDKAMCNINASCQAPKEKFEQCGLIVTPYCRDENGKVVTSALLPLNEVKNLHNCDGKLSIGS